jgi:hypothetical protein
VVYVGFGLLAAMAVTGVRIVRGSPGSGASRRRTHRRFAWAFLASIMAATALGFTMTSLATPE